MVRKPKYSEVGLPYYFLNPVLALWEQICIKITYKIYFTLIADGLEMK